MPRLPAVQTKMFNGSFVHTTDKPALSIGTEDGQSLWIELTDEQALDIVSQGMYYLERKARLIFARERNAA